MSTHKKIIALCLLSFIISLYGCAFVSQSLNDERLSGVTPEMSKQEVLALLGKPAQIYEENLSGIWHEIWKYPIQHHFAGKYNALDDVSYLVIFERGKVWSWQKARVYAQSSFVVDTVSITE